jgi:hypothetical protein
VEVKGKMQEAANFADENQSNAVNTARNKAKA